MYDLDIRKKKGRESSVGLPQAGKGAGGQLHVLVMGPIRNVYYFMIVLLTEHVEFPLSWWHP